MINTINPKLFKILKLREIKKYITKISPKYLIKGKADFNEIYFSTEKQDDAIEIKQNNKNKNIKYLIFLFMEIFLL